MLDRHPFDVVGWDGYVYPYTFNADDFEPRAGRFHLPPPAHQTFQGPNFVICTFAPRMLDWDETAVPLPYHHSNIQSEEVMFYADGDYAARKGVDVGCLTLHPSGLPHGPQPGAVEKALGATRTDELAVMWDTFRPLSSRRCGARSTTPTTPTPGTRTGRRRGTPPRSRRSGWRLGGGTTARTLARVRNVRGFTWRDGERTIRFGRGLRRRRARAAGRSGYVLLTTARARGCAPAVETAAGDLVEVPAGRVDELAADLLPEVRASGGEASSRSAAGA